MKTKIVELTNDEMYGYLNFLNTVDAGGSTGYAVVRNTRKISDAVKEYITVRDNYIIEHGEENDDGTYKIDTTQMAEDIGDIANTKTSIEICIADGSEDNIVASGLTSRQILGLSWMIDMHDDTEEEAVEE